MSRLSVSARGLVLAALLAIAGSLAVVSGQAPQVNAGGRPNVPQEVRDAITRDGRARVIVTLSGGAFTPEGRLGNAPAVAAQRQRLATARGRVLARAAAGAARELRRFQTLPLAALEVDAAALAALETSPDVASVTPDRVLRPSLDISVPHIEGDQAWEAGFDGTGTTIAVVDSGVDATHPFLIGKVVNEACFSSTSPGLSRSLCPSGASSEMGPGAAAPCALDGCFHGTHVAGIAAGVDLTTTPTMGGVARGANLVAVQVFSEITDAAACGDDAPCLGGFESDVIAGLEYVYGLKVSGLDVAAVNMSLGGGAFPAPCDGEPFKPAIDNLRALGVASVVASGNNAEVTHLAAPACVSTAISVGATDANDEVAWFSNVSQFLSLLAPGDGIVSSMPGGTFEALSGTSMAAPHVAGAWAILHQAAPNASVDVVLAALRNTGLPVTDTRGWAPGNITAPRIRVFSALAAIASVSSPLPTLTSATPTTLRTGAPATLTIAGSGFNQRSGVRWNGVELPSIAMSGHQILATVPTSELSIGTFQLTVTNPSPGGGTSDTLFVHVLAPPSLTVSQAAVGPGAPVTVTLTDGYGGQLDWLALASSTAPNSNYLASTFVGNGTMTRTWTVAAPMAPGPYEFRLFLNNGLLLAATSPTFTVDAAISPVPLVASISPAEAIAGSAALPLTVIGSRFVPTSEVTWNGSARATTFVSATELRTTISAADLSSAGLAAVAVTTPAPGGGSSSALTFNVIPTPVLTPSSTSIPAGATVTVTLTQGLGGSLDWLAFAPVSAASNSYTQFTYVGSGVTTRTWTVTAPTTAGPYEFRLFRQGTFTRVATSPTVTVTAPPPPSLAVSTTSIGGGQALTVTLANGPGGSQDWLSFGSTSAADNTYLQFTYIGAGVTTRTWTVTTPNTGGTYEFRLFRQGSYTRLATSASVTVIGPPPPSPTLAVNLSTVAPGASVTATLTNGAGGASDVLALAATGAPDGTFIQSVLVGANVTTRAWTVTMPVTPGTYEFRLFVNGTRAATSPTVTVSVPTTVPPTLTVNQSTVTSGSPVTVTLAGGLGGSQDWIAFAPVGAANNSYAQFTYVGTGVTARTWTVTAPTTTGQYEFRLFKQGSYTRLATSAPVSVQSPPPPVLSVSLTTAAPGQSVTVTLTNGSGVSTDWLAFAVVGAPANTYVAWTYVGAVTTRTWTVTMPATPGTYEFRLFRQSSFVLSATSPQVVVN